MNGSTQLLLRRDVLLIPVRDLDDEMRARLECAEDDVALSLPAARGASSVVDSGSAALLERFRRPCSVIDAVILYSREKGLDPEAVLEGAYPVIQQLLDRRFLVHADASESEVRSPLGPGDQVEGRRVAALLYLMEDTELHLMRGPDGAWSALKMQRAADPALAERLDHEARILRRLGGSIAPALLGEGIHDGRRYLLLEWCRGVDAATAAGERRSGPPESAAADTLDLCRRIAGAYAELHDSGVLHGDVHPRNVLVDRGGAVRLLDFGLGREREPSRDGGAHHARGGVPFFFDPEHALALLEEGPLPPLTAAADQYSLAVLLYHVITGAYPAEFSLERSAMLRQIAAAPPLPISAHGVPPWPELEATLGRALRKRAEERFDSVADLARALASIAPPRSASPRAGAARGSHSVDACLDEAIELAGLGGGWLSGGLKAAPTASITFGAAGIAFALLRVSCLRDDPRLLALADVWAWRAAQERSREDAFYNAAIEITKEIVGESAVYHTECGVHAVRALVARALGDPMAQGEAIAMFLDSSRRPAAGLDLTLGRAGQLLACALLLDGLDDGGSPVRAATLEAGRRILDDLWGALERENAISGSRIDALGIAHGWAGLLYAALSWSAASGDDVPPHLDRRLAELVDLALPSGRGSRWPWRLGGGRAGPVESMPGWCNGSAGYALLFGLARGVLGDDACLEPAIAAAWDAWEAPDLAGSLCCGLAGRAYALLEVHRQTGDVAWLRRARELAERAARRGSFDPTYAHSLYKGRLGLAVLAADLERPEEAAMPFFQREIARTP